MKNKGSVLMALIAIVCAAVSVTGCPSLPEPTPEPVRRAVRINNENQGVFGEIRLLPVKDFVSVGLVFTESQFETTEAGGFDGRTFTYQALLKEAQKLGAHAIINVTIDRLVENITTIQGDVTGRGRRESWLGSALAIKYTDPLKDDYMVQSTTRNNQLNTGASQVSDQPGAPAQQPTPATPPAQPTGRRTGF